MRVPVVQIRIVRMFMPHRRMAVGVAMRCARRIIRAVMVPVMAVMLVQVIMLQQFVDMLVLMRLGEVQI